MDVFCLLKNSYSYDVKIINRMFVGTWNVGGKSPNEELNLADWLNSSAPADIYVLGYVCKFYLDIKNIICYG